LSAHSTLLSGPAFLESVYRREVKPDQTIKMLAAASAASRALARPSVAGRVVSRGMAQSAALDFHDPLNWQSLLTDDEKMIQVGWGS
jgi:hypothetical protein